AGNRLHHIALSTHEILRLRIHSRLSSAARALVPTRDELEPIADRCQSFLGLRGGADADDDAPWAIGLRPDAPQVEELSFRGIMPPEVVLGGVGSPRDDAVDHAATGRHALHALEHARCLLVPTALA